MLGARFPRHWSDRSRGRYVALDHHVADGCVQLSGLGYRLMEAWQTVETYSRVLKIPWGRRAARRQHSIHCVLDQALDLPDGQRS